MKGIGPRTFTAAILAAAGALLCACATTAPPRRSALQEKIGSPGGGSATELRLRLYEIPQQLGGIVETAAERIRAESSDPVVRRRALVWEADGIPAIYASALRPDPLAGALDLWVLLYQMDDYLETGAGKDAFGPQQPVAVDAARQMLALIEGTASSLYTDQELYEKRKANVRKFAGAHPIQGAFSARETALSELARFSATESVGGLAAVGQATETLADISLRLNAYMTLLPKLVRWQAELAAEDVMGRADLGGVLDDVHAIGQTALRADALLADIPGAARAASGPIQELLDRQRAELLAAVDRERLSVAAFVTAEREAALAAVDEQRRAASATIASERAAVLAGMDGLAKKSIEDASGRVRRVADVVFWRALILVVAAAALFAVALRVGRGGRGPSESR